MHLEDRQENLFFQVGPLTAMANGQIVYQDALITLHEGDFAFLAGPSGCGKTTLLRQIVGLNAFPCEGRFLAGKRYGPEDLPLFRRDCLLLLQDAPLLGGTVEENLTFPFTLKLARKRYDPSTAKTLLETLGLGHLSPTQPAQELSLGERHRLALVRALLWDPIVILADEPFSGLDRENLEKAQNLLFSFTKRPGKAVLCVSHAGIPQEATKVFRFSGKSLVSELVR